MNNINVKIKIGKSFHYLRVRRIFEFFLIVFLLPFAIPLALVIVVLIKLESPGRSIFTQQRPGKHGKIFNIYKFRSMVQTSNHNAFRLATEHDERITVVGKWLRRYRLDELPQLWNILKGDMSFIGPRPVPIELYKHYKSKIPNYDLRHTILPGITGWAQVNLGYTNTLKGEIKKWHFDIEYLNQVGFKKDFLILKRTVYRLFAPENN